MARKAIETLRIDIDQDKETLAELIRRTVQ